MLKFDSSHWFSILHNESYFQLALYYAINTEVEIINWSLLVSRDK